METTYFVNILTTRGQTAGIDAPQNYREENRPGSRINNNNLSSN